MDEINEPPKQEVFEGLTLVEPLGDDTHPDILYKNHWNQLKRLNSTDKTLSEFARFRRTVDYVASETLSKWLQEKEETDENYAEFVRLDEALRSYLKEKNGF